MQIHPCIAARSGYIADGAFSQKHDERGSGMAAFLQRSPGVLTGGVLFGAFAAAAIAPQTRLFSGGAFAGKFGEPLSFVLAGGAAGLAAALLLQTGKGRRFPLSWLAAAVFPAVTGGWFLGGLAGWSLVFWNPGLLSFDYRSSEAVYAGWVAGSLAGQLCGWAFAVFGTLLSPEPEPGSSFLSLAFPARSFWTDLAWAAVIGEGLLLLTCFLSPCSSGSLWRFPHWLGAGLGILAGVWISAGWIAALVFAWFGVTRGEDEKRCGQVRTVALILGIVLIPGGLLLNIRNLGRLP